MSDDAIRVPDVSPENVAVMIYQPASKKVVESGVEKWIKIPGAYSKHTSVLQGTWEDFVEGLRKPLVVNEKFEAPAMSPGILVDGSARRANMNVRFVGGMLCMDLDSVEDMEQVARRLIEHDLEAVMYSTASHLLPGKGPRYRLIVRLSRHVSASEWLRFVKPALLYVTGDAEGRIQADRSCIDPSRVFFLPSVLKGREATFEFVHRPGRALDPDEVYDAVGSVPTLAATGREDHDRLSTLATTRAMLTPSSRKFDRSSIEALAKNKKAGLPTDQRKALAAAAKGERMVVVKGEMRPDVIRQGASAGGVLCDADIDPFFTALMFRVAVHYRNADPVQVEQAFAQSFGIVRDDDAQAGNVTYEPSALRSKFESGVRKADEKSIEDAKTYGLPTPEEFKAAQGIEDEGDIGAAKVSVYLGQRCFYVARSGDDGELQLRPISNFSIEPTMRLRSEGAGAMNVRDTVYRCTIYRAIDPTKPYRDVAIDLESLTSKAAINKAVASIEGVSFAGTDDQALALKTTLYDYIKRNDVPTRTMTHRIGTHPDKTVVAPGVTFAWGGGYEVKHVEGDAKVFHKPTANLKADGDSAVNEEIASELSKRSTDVDIEAIRAFTRHVVNLNEPEVAHTLAAWFAVIPVKPILHELKIRTPYVMVVGSKGSGKTSIVELWLDALGGVKHAVNNMPFHSIARAAAGVTSLPVVFDEFRDTGERGKAEARIAMLRDMLRNNFDGTIVTRSNMATIHLEAPVIVIGEQRVFGTDAALDSATSERVICVRPESNTLDPSKSPNANLYKQAHSEISRMSPGIQDSGMWALFQSFVIGRWGDREALVRFFDEALARVEAHVKTTGISVHPRTVKCLAVTYLGAWIWNDWCAFVGVPSTVPPIEVICAHTLDELSPTRVAEDSEDRREIDPIAIFVEELSRMVAEKGQLGGLDGMKFWGREGDVLYLSTSASIRYFHLSNGSGTLIADERQLYAYARSSPFAVHVDGSERVMHKIRNSGYGRPIRCVAVNVPRLEAAGVELSEAFLQDEDTDGPKPSFS